MDEAHTSAAAKTSAYYLGYSRATIDAATVAKTLGVHPHLNVWQGGPEWYKHAQEISRAIMSLTAEPSVLRQDLQLPPHNAGTDAPAIRGE